MNIPQSIVSLYPEYEALIEKINNISTDDRVAYYEAINKKPETAYFEIKLPFDEGGWTHRIKLPS